MKITGRAFSLEIIIGVALLVAGCAAAFDPNNIIIYIAILLLLIMSTKFLMCIALYFCKKKSLTKITIYLIAFLLLIPSMRFGAWLRDKDFERKLPDYTRATHVIETELPQGVVPLSRISLPFNYGKLAYAATAERSVDGVITIEFITAVYFPVRHSGYLFRSDGDESDILKRRWPVLRRINSNWFYFAD